MSPQPFNAFGQLAFERCQGVILDLEGVDPDYRVVQIFPNVHRMIIAGFYNNLGVARDKVGDIMGAIDAHLNAIRLMPNVTEAHVDLGVALADVGDYQGAIKQHRKALEIYPHIAAAHIGIGYALSKLSDREVEGTEKRGSLAEGAEKEYRNALEIDPNNYTALKNLEVILYKAGRDQAVVDLYLEMMAKFSFFSNSMHWNDLGFAYNKINGKENKNWLVPAIAK